MTENGVHITIIIPVYNAARYIQRCLDAVLNQTLQAIEVICVNDASTDNSLEILKQQQAKDGRLRVVAMEKAGQGVARNTGIQMAKGRYIGFVDADDRIDERMFETLMDAATNNDADIACCYTDCVDSRTGRHVHIPYFEQDRNIPGDEQVSVYSREEIPALLPFITVVPWNKIYKTSFLKEHQVVFDMATPHEDILFSFCALTNASSLVICREALYQYTVNREASTMNSFHKGNYDRILQTLVLTEKAIAAELENPMVRSAFETFKVKQLMHSLNAALLNRQLGKKEKADFFTAVRRELGKEFGLLQLNAEEQMQLYMIRHNFRRWCMARLYFYQYKSKLFRQLGYYG